MAVPTSFQELIDDSYLGGLERQRRLVAVVGEGTAYDGRYDIDLQAGTLRFTGAEVLDVGLHLIGSAALGPGTWQWGWHDVNGFPEPVVAVAEQLRVLGERWGLAALADPEIPLQRDPRTDATTYATVAGMFAGGLPWYAAEAGGGVVVALLLEHELLALPPAQAQDALWTLTAGLSADPGSVADWRRAVDAYGRRRGLQVELQPDGALRLVGPDGWVEARFDELGRVAQLITQLEGAP